MFVAKTVAEMRARRFKNKTVSWGFVPTMGALHAGHLSLVRRAQAENDRVAVSIFVNPKQFNNASDLKNYPRTTTGDLALLRKAGVNLVFLPQPGEIYPTDFQTYVTVEEVAKPLEGAARPGHFRGMATVVTKLFNIVEPTRAYFGQKDAQQVIIVKQMVRDLNMSVDIVVCPTLRENDGLAMSSRNVRLAPKDRKAATILYKSLMAAQQAWNHKTRSAQKLRDMAHAVLTREPKARVEYVSVADPTTLQELEGNIRQALLSLAVHIGDVRLIDNIILP